MSRTLVVQALGDFQSVHRMHPIKMFRNQSGFVGLDGADEMPLHIIQMCQCQLLVQCFLQVIFTKGALTRRIGFGHRCGRLGFADGDQLHSLWISSGSDGRLVNSCGDFPQLVVYLVHIRL